MVALTGGRPTASSAGNVTSVPEPTTALIAPATRPASATRTASHPDTTWNPLPLARRGRTVAALAAVPVATARAGSLPGRAPAGGFQRADPGNGS